MTEQGKPNSVIGSVFFADVDQLRALPRLITEGLDGKDPDWIDAVAEKFRYLYARFADRASTAYTEDAAALGKELHDVCSVLREHCKGYETKAVFYLGQLYALYALTRRLEARTVPLRAMNLVRKSRPAMLVLSQLMNRGLVGLDELEPSIGPEVGPAVTLLERADLVYRERTGNSCEIGLLPLGREVGEILLAAHT